MFDFELEQEPWKMMSTSSNSFDNDDEYRFMSSPAASEFHPEEIPQGSKTRVRGRRTKKETASGHARKRLLSEEQVKLLETRFAEDRKLECKRKVQLSNELGLEAKQVAVWFQNRRARDKSKRMEAAFLELQSIHHDTVIKKCQIENEVLQLKQKLLETQEQQRKLSDLVTRSAAAGSEKVGSPSSPTLTRKPNGAEFGVVEASDELMYIEHNNYMMDWWAIPCMQHLTPNCCVSNNTNLGV